MDGIHVALTGRIGTEPERRFAATGSEVVQFSILPEDTRADPERPEWIRCSTFVDKLDEGTLGKLRKGATVYIEGRLKLGRWTGQDGAPRSGLNVNAWQVVVLGAIGRRANAARVRQPEQRPRGFDPIEGG